METKVIMFFLACVSVAAAGRLPEKTYLEPLEGNDGYANYEFAYNVADIETGDVKSQQENRDGDNVQGQYTLNDADGYRRIVDYSVNGDSGFRAVVRREQVASVVAAPKPIVTTPRPTIKPQPDVKVKAIAPPASLLRTTVVHHHQPTVYHAAPAVHLAPTAHFVHSARAAAPTVITTHHHTPAALLHHTSPAVNYHTPAVVHHAPATVVHHAPATAVVHHHTPSVVATPHHQVSYVHYH